MNTINYDLTNPQKEILLTEQFNNNTCVSNICGTLSINQKINIEYLEKSINLFIKNNDSIRINLYNDGSSIKQFIKNYSYVNIQKTYLGSSYTLSDLENDIVNRPFTLLNNNLYNFVIFINTDGTGGFMANLHHIISDAWTMSLLIDQIMSYYSSFLDNKPIEDVLNNSYTDFINNEQIYLNSDKFKNSKKFWEEQFDTLEFSYLKDYQSSSYEAIRKSFTLSLNETNTLLTFCKQHHTSLFSLFMAVLTIYLSKINNTKSAIVGTPILNRSNFKEKNTTGMFISTVPFKMEIEENCSCIDLIDQVSKHELSVLRHQRYPYNYVLDTIRKKYNITKNLYDVCLSYQNARNHRLTSSVPYSCRWLFNNCVVNNLDIHLYDIDDTGMINIYYDFKKDLFSIEDISLLHNRLMEMIKQIINEPNLKIYELDIVSTTEKLFILENYNKKPEKNSNFISVYELFQRQVCICPDKIAIFQNNIGLTYKELNNLANLIALKLKKYSINYGDIVCLAFKNSIEFVASVLAIQKLGACYIPIDVNYPEDRIKYIIKNSNSKIILTQDNLLNSIDLNGNSLVKINLYDFNYKSEVQNLNFMLKENDLAYIIYTSGSTGNPKGVKISHKSLSNYITWAIKKYVNNEETNFPLFSSIAFDLTVTSIYTPLCSGNSIYIYNNDNPQLLLKEIIEDKKVQIIKLTPGHFSLLKDLNLSESIVTKFILGGDLLNKEICEQIVSLINHPIHIYNEYGPTEATVGCMIYEYSFDTHYNSVPIGVPIDNTQILILNNSLRLCPLGSVGEIYISGDCLSLGYTDTQKTSEKFVDNPFYPQYKLYKTGDLAILHSNGIMEYIGRNDFQVKINGYRIELGEIQSVLLTHQSIKDVFVTVCEMCEHKVLCVYYVSDKNINNLSDFLKEKLPTYMIPRYYIRLDNIPLTINGKVDKSKLPLPVNKKNEYVAPTNKLETTLQDLFTYLLNLENKISITDNLFDYYIDSLSLIKAQSILYNKGISVNTQSFYEYPTIQKLSEFILSNRSEKISPIIEDLPRIPEIIKPINVIPKLDNILLFGATGFLGIHILYYLLLNTNCKVFCIVRKKGSISPIARLIKKCKFYFPTLNIDKYLHRIKIIEGNILDDNFGLDKNTYEYLGKIGDCVIDTAALVKHYGNYELFNKTNVNSTKKMISFCLTYNIPFHYLSTMSVSGYGLVATPNTNFTEDDLYIGQSFNKNVYVRSKFEAEKAILNACKNDNLIASIYRLGTITNRYSDGVFQENYKDNAFLNRLESFINLGIFPQEFSNFLFEFTPVDFCAKFIVKLLQNKSNNLNIYHLYNNNFISSPELISMLKELGTTLLPVPLDEFNNALSNSKNNYFGITAYMKNINNEIIFKNEKTLSILKSLNLQWPNITLEYIKKILLYLRNKHSNGGNI